MFPDDPPLSLSLSLRRTMSPVRDSMSSKKGTHSTATATSTPTPTSSTASNPPATPFGAPPEVGESPGTHVEGKRDATPPDPEVRGHRHESRQTTKSADEGKHVDQDNVSLISQVRCLHLNGSPNPSRVRDKPSCNQSVRFWYIPGRLFSWDLAPLEPS